MKKIFCLVLAVIMLAPAVLATYDSSESAQSAIDEYMASLPPDETDDTGKTQIYPEAFGGMYVGDDNSIVVCLTDDTPENEQVYIDYFGSADNLKFETVALPYSTLMQYYITIGARHVSTQYVIINLYKTKRYEINVKENRVDIWMFAEEDTLEEVLQYMDGLGFGEGIYIYFVDENDTEVLTNEDEVYTAKTEREASATPTPTPTPTPTVGEELESSGLTFKQVGIPIIAVVVIIGVWFAVSKLRSRKTDLSEIDDFSDEHK